MRSGAYVDRVSSTGSRVRYTSRDARTIDAHPTVPTMKILHVSQPGEGGVANYVGDLALHQMLDGEDVTVVSPAESPLANRTLEVGARHVDWAASRSPTPTTVGEMRRLNDVVRACDPEIVHLHSSKAGLCGRVVLRGRRPVVFQPHGWSFNAVGPPIWHLTVAWERFATRWADAIVCVSDGERAVGEAVRIRDKVHVVPNGVDPAVWTYASEEDRRGSRDRLSLRDDPLVLCVGRLQAQKGQDRLLEAWPLVRKHVPHAELVLVGDGPDERHLRRRAEPGVVFTGVRNDVADWLAAADVVVLPSRSEGMPIVMLEAMARGRSVVATDVAGVRDCLAGGAGGIVSQTDPRGLALAVVDRLLDPERATTEGALGRQRVEATFNLDRTRAGIDAVYRKVLDPVS